MISCSLSLPACIGNDLTSSNDFLMWPSNTSKQAENIFHSLSYSLRSVLKSNLLKMQTKKKKAIDLETIFSDAYTNFNSIFHISLSHLFLWMSIYFSRMSHCTKSSYRKIHSLLFIFHFIFVYGKQMFDCNIFQFQLILESGKYYQNNYILSIKMSDSSMGSHFECATVWIPLTPWDGVITCAYFSWPDERRSSWSSSTRPGDTRSHLTLRGSK